MKKIFALALALCLLCGATAFATTTTLTPSSSSGDTILTTTIAETYTLTIPATLNIAFEATETDLPLTVSDYRLKSSHMIRLSQSWDGKLEYNDGTTSYSLSYALKHNGTNVSSDSNPVTFTSNGTVNLTVAITEAAWNSAAAGEYTDTVTFTSAIVNK